MKITVIQSVYLKNPLVPDALVRNIVALTNSGIDFQYIVYNDKGDAQIEDDIKHFINTLEIDSNLERNFNNVEYVYSDINYGKKMCTGGYVGAIPYIKGDLIHNIGQDDIYTEEFYTISMKTFIDNPEIYFVTSNALDLDEKFKSTNIMMHPDLILDCSKPIEVFKIWFGITPPLYEVTQANNGFLAPGTMYKRELHDLIGEWDLENFRGAADFEYWARILYNGYSGYYISQPNWYYRMSKYSAGNEIIDGKPNRGYWQQLHIQAIKEKYTNLVQQNKDKFK